MVTWLNLGHVNMYSYLFRTERFGLISGPVGLAIGILARLSLAKIQTIARPDPPDMPLK